MNIFLSICIQGSTNIKSFHSSFYWKNKMFFEVSSGLRCCGHIMTASSYTNWINCNRIYLQKFCSCADGKIITELYKNRKFSHNQFFSIHQYININTHVNTEKKSLRLRSWLGVCKVILYEMFLWEQQKYFIKKSFISEDVISPLPYRSTHRSL